MRLRHVEVFHAVYTCGSMTKAASLLNVSQPSISKVLAHAETQIGFPLFDRQGGKLTPTPEATRLFSHVREVYDALARVRRVAQNLRDASEGSLRLACTPAMGVSIVPKVLAQFLKQPGAVFEIETLHLSEMTEALREGRIDVALAFDPQNIAGLTTRSVWTGKFVIIAPPGLAELFGDNLAIEDIGDLPFIRLHSKGPLGQLLDAHFSDVGASPNVVAVTETYQIARALVAEGAGIAIIDEITARSDTDADITVLNMHPELNFDVCALHVEESPLSRLAERFLEMLSLGFSEHLGHT